MPFKPAVTLDIWLNKHTGIPCQNYQIACDQFWQNGKSIKIVKIHLLIAMQMHTECRFADQEIEEDRDLTSLKSS